MSLIDPRLAEILVCPVDHGALTQNVEDSVLECQQCERAYRVEDGIPVMLIDEEDEG
jgi:uncharacterized protein